MPSVAEITECTLNTCLLMHSSSGFILKFTCLENGATVLYRASLYWSTEQYLLLWQVATRPKNMLSINSCKGTS